MNCNNCGNILSTNDGVCSKCGTLNPSYTQNNNQINLQQQKMEQQIPYVNPVTSYEQLNKQINSKNPNLILYIVLAVVIVVAIICVTLTITLT